MIGSGPGRLYRQALALHSQYEGAVLGPIRAQGHWNDSKRHRTGAFYTPAHLVRFVIAHTLYPTTQAWIEQGKQARKNGDRTLAVEILRQATGLQVVDPACGCGRFLLDAFRVLRDFHVWLARLEACLLPASEYEHRIAEFGLVDLPRNKWTVGWCLGTLRALGCLRGYDVNPQAVAATREILLAMTGLTGRSETVNAAEMAQHLLQKRIQVGDTLADHHLAGATDAERQTIDARGDQGNTGPEPQWNIVIGNPPWGALGSHRATAIRLGLPIENVNSFGLFLVNCVAKLPIEGRLGFVLPRNFCKGRDYQVIRRRLLQDTALEWLADAGQAFPQVTQEVVVLVLRRLSVGRRNQQVRLTRVDAESPLGTDTHSITAAHFAQTPGNVFTLNARQEHLDVLAQMEQQAEMPLRYAVTWARGVEYGRAGALIRCPNCGAYTSAPRKKQVAKACPTCREVLSSLETAYNLIAEQADRRHTVPIYAGKHVRRYWLDKPNYIDPNVPGIAYKDRRLFTAPKLLIPKIAPFLAVAIETDAAWTTQGVYMLRSKDAIWDAYALLGLLNSAPLAFYYEYRYNDAAVLTTNVTLAHLLALPLPQIADTQLLEMIRIGARTLSAVERPAGRIMAAHAENERIDEAVCRLFSLSAQQSACVKAWREQQLS
ncbi:MAG TPA: hypothetical protein GXZ82_08605 [Firmicutes bacterium]|nr:hypothetical protein [Bacillota bacterium]